MINANIMSLVCWPEDELSKDISEQVEVNEATKAPTSIRTMGKTLTSQLQAKQILQVKGK